MKIHYILLTQLFSCLSQVMTRNEYCQYTYNFTHVFLQGFTYICDHFFSSTLKVVFSPINQLKMCTDGREFQRYFKKKKKNANCTKKNLKNILRYSRVKRSLLFCIKSIVVTLLHFIKTQNNIYMCSKIIDYQPLMQFNFLTLVTFRFNEIVALLQVLMFI